MPKLTIKHYLEIRLNHWARWILKGYFSGLGYPTSSAIYEWLKYGCTLERHAHQDMISYDPDAEEMEAYIQKLHKQDPKAVLALRIEYLSRDTLSKKAAKMRVSKAQFNFLVRLAKQWLAGRLSR